MKEQADHFYCRAQRVNAKKLLKYCMSFSFVWLLAACAAVQSVTIIRYAVSSALALPAELLLRNVVVCIIKQDGM